MSFSNRKSKHAIPTLVASRALGTWPYVCLTLACGWLTICAKPSSNWKKSSWWLEGHGWQGKGTSHSKTQSWNGNLKANWDKSVTRGFSHRSILNLDKSDEPFSIQIAVACDILGINLKEPSSYLLSDVEQQEDQTTYGPQEEWTLRWLLKNLQSTDLQPARKCYTPHSPQ